MVAKLIYISPEVYLARYSGVDQIYIEKKKVEIH